MTMSARIYAGDAIGFGGWPAINDLLSAGYNTVILWSVHVDTDGTLYLNDTKLASGGNYDGAFPFNLPARVARLRQAGVEIIFSVGAGGTKDFTNIGNLLNGSPGGPSNPVYDNFKALKDAMKAGGGDIDAIDFDNEDKLDANVMTNFGITLANIGYANVTFCPYDYLGRAVWFQTMSQLVSAKGSGFVNAIHLQVYSGGRWYLDKVADWKNGFASAGGTALMIPGLATNQAQPGPWWADGAMGGSVLKTPNVAMYENANWDNYLYTWNFATAEEALQGAQTAASFFFYCRAPLVLTNGRSFQTGDAVYFTGSPWWSSASQCDAYYLGGSCSNTYNNLPGACPADLRTQFAEWGSAIDGGFIWLYDSVISCLLSPCCGGTVDKPTATAWAYRQAITG